MVKKNRPNTRTNISVETLSTLIASKVNLFCHIKCHQFKPEKDLLSRAKKATLASAKR